MDLGERRCGSRAGGGGGARLRSGSIVCKKNKDKKKKKKPENWRKILGATNRLIITFVRTVFSVFSESL